MSNSYAVRLTGAQLRVLHETLSVVTNDPDWFETSGISNRDADTLNRAHDILIEAWRAAARTESTPATTH